jgi:hypothetical protein
MPVIANTLSIDPGDRPSRHAMGRKKLVVILESHREALFRNLEAQRNCRINQTCLPQSALSLNC